MSELIGLFVLGLVLAIGCSFMLSSRLDRQSPAAGGANLRDDQRTSARLESLANPHLQPPEPTIGVILEPSGRGGTFPLRRAS